MLLNEVEQSGGLADLMKSNRRKLDVQFQRKTMYSTKKFGNAKQISLKFH